MKGDIYTRQKCSECGGKLVHDHKARVLRCPQHPLCIATTKFIVRFGREISKQFSSYDRAEYFLNGLRFKEYEGTFDAKDYRQECPYAFEKQAKDYVIEKERSGMVTIQNVRNYMARASEYFNGRNVKEIKKKELSDFLYSLDVSDKTKANYRSTLNDFFTRFLIEGEIIEKAPTIPVINYELGYRKIVDMNAQAAILDKLYALTWETNPKVYFGVDLLRTYLSLRPNDLLRLKEEDVKVEPGALIVWRPTKRKNRRKVIMLLPEHVEMVKALKSQFPAFPAMPFFRHHGQNNRAKAGQAFGEKYLYKWWVRACEKVGVSGVDLYAGTRHSTTTALALEVGEQNAKDATGHDTNKAFWRYCQVENANALKMAGVVRGKVVVMPLGVSTESAPEKKASGV